MCSSGWKSVHPTPAVALAAIVIALVAVHVIAWDVGVTDMEVTYRPKEHEMIPSATYINGESVFAEVAMKNADLAVCYVTGTGLGVYHIWIAWADDDPKREDFIVINPLTDDGESLFNFTDFSSAMRVAAELSMTGR
jgi:hypothetical protein